MIASCPCPSAVVAERDAADVEIVVHRVARLREIECRSKIDAREN